MKNSFFILSIMSILLLFTACTKDENNVKTATNTPNNETKDELLSYDGPSLTIGVVGGNDFKESPKVIYENLTLEELSKNSKDDILDALIIKKNAFEEADKDKYVSLYNSTKYPIFFYGTEDLQAFAFTDSGVTMDQVRVKNTAYVQGYLNLSGEKQHWDLLLSNKPTNKEKNETMLIRILELVASRK
ncbi:hypothetical protein [Bacillus sp. E214]|uniref:hypothetical protein n=1 Tax=Bacillus sp. E214 TaxID=2587156 RepID=UPI0011E0260B|nr:hypothetical protein [Bacillus sp. E214]